MLSITSLHAGYGAGKNYREILADLSLTCRAGETLALVGGSGCGKSTLARCVARLQPISSGAMYLDELAWSDLSQRQLVSERWRVQMVFQDPDRSLDPRWTIGASIAEGLSTSFSPPERHHKVLELLDAVGLDHDFIARYPHQCSGGQKQRVGIARALAPQPQLLIADEAVSALDVSIQAQVLNLLQDMQEQFQFACLFISHDLAVVSHVADSLAVMSNGRIVEHGETSKVLHHAQHPVTQSLMAARHPIPL